MKQIKPMVMLLGGGLGALTTTALGTSLAWIVYSRLVVNHHQLLTSAIPAERRTFTSPSAGQVSYYADESPSGRPLVLLHSINAAASAYEMRPLFQHYRATRPVYALDLPGFGFSERTDRAYTPRLYTQAIAEFLAGEVGKMADVIALSLTGEFAARAALENPSAFHSLILISPTGLALDRREPVSEETYELFRFPLWSQAFFDLLATKMSIRWFLQKSVVSKVDPGLVDYAYQTSHRPGARYAPLHFIGGRLFSPHIRTEVYDQLRLPVLVLYDQDEFTTFEELPGLLESRRNWHAERIVPTRGLPHWEKLEGTVQAIDRFWQTLPQGVTP